MSTVRKRRWPSTHREPSGAYSMRKEREIGSLEKGKAADMVVLDRNLFEIDPGSIVDTKVVYTIFAGKVVYDANAGTGTSPQPARDTHAPRKGDAREGRMR